MANPIVASYCTTFLKSEMRHIYRQVSGLKRYETFVLTRERACEEQYPFSEVEVIPRAKKNFIKRFWLKYLRRLPAVYYRGELQEVIKILKRRPADLMHIYFGHTGVHLLPFIKEWDRPCVVSFHGMDIQSRPQQAGYDEQMGELLRAAPLLLARSRSLMDRLVEMGAPRERVRLNRTGIPLDAFPKTERTKPANGEWRIVQACRLIEKKGLLTSLRAFAAFHQKWPSARFIIGGDGPMKQKVMEFARELGIEDAVELKGFLDQAQLAELYKTGHFFLHPSEMTSDQNQEGVPNSMLEAMATGMPVLATLHGGIPEAIAHEISGLLVKERDHEALAGYMLHLAESPEAARRMGSAAARSVREEFSQQRAIEKLESFYDEARKMDIGSQK